MSESKREYGKEELEQRREYIRLKLEKMSSKAERRRTREREAGKD